MPKDFSLADHKRQVAIYLREKEAHMCRGQIDRLNALDQMSDKELLVRWSWRSAILGAIIAFLGGPLLINIVRLFLPELLLKLVWALIQVSMVLSMMMLGTAMYLTVSDRGEN